MNDVTILTLADRAAWEREHADGGLPSQSWRYASAVQASGFEPKLAVVRSEGSRMLLPFVEREWRGTVDIATLPGLSGLSIDPPSAAPLGAWRDFAIGQGWICGYLQIDPRLQVDALPPGSQLVRQNSMFLLDPSTWSLQKSTYRTIRQKLTYALRDGARAADGLTLLEPLQELYPETMRRFEAKPAYSRETLEQWARDPANLLVGVVRDGIVHGVHLIHVAGAHAEAQIGGLTKEGRDDSVVLYVHAIELLAARGVTSYNIGAGGPEGAGVYQLKKWLGAQPLALRSIRQVYDADRYAGLCERAGVSDDHEGWFPPYRAAAARSS